MAGSRLVERSKIRVKGPGLIRGYGFHLKHDVLGLVVDHGVESLAHNSQDRAVVLPDSHTTARR